MLFFRAARITFFYAVLFILSACSSSSDGTSPPSVGSDTATSDDESALAVEYAKTELPIQGLYFRDEDSTLRDTKENGQFKFQEGAPLTFYIGDLSFYVEDPESILPLYKLVGETSYSDPESNPKTIGLIRLLFSIDSDQNPNNGITIPEPAYVYTRLKSLDVFEDEVELLSYARYFKPSITALIPASKAMSMFWLAIGKGDSDEDGIPDTLDNCILDANFSQLDLNNNDTGDLCEGVVPSDPVVAAKNSIVIESKAFVWAQLNASDANNTEIRYEITKQPAHYQVNVIHNIASISAQKQCTGNDYFEYVGINEFGQRSEPTRVEIEEECNPTDIADIYFPDENLRRCVTAQAYDNGSQNLSSITKLVCRGLGIKSTEGLHHLPALKSLNLFDNRLSFVDLSQNTLLERLFLGTQELKTLDLSANIKLEHLKLQSPGLNKLTLSGPQAIEFFELHSADKEVLDFSKLKSIKTINLYDMDIESLTLASTNLNEVELELETLKELIFSQESHLQAIRISKAKLNLLETAANTKIDTLKITDSLLSGVDLPSAKYIELYNIDPDSQKELDLSNHLDLLNLTIENYPLTSLNLRGTDPKYLKLRHTEIDQISSNPFSFIEYLELSANSTSSEDLLALFTFTQEWYDGFYPSYRRHTIEDILVSDSDYYSVYPLKDHTNPDDAVPQVEADEADLAQAPDEAEGAPAEDTPAEPDFDNDGTVDSKDVDMDNDKLIEISSLAELNNIRSHNLSNTDHSDNLGCPQGGCKGFELIADLDFDTNQDGVFNAGDTFYNSREGWAPIVDFDSIFEGNGHTISNLFVNRPNERYAGLFANSTAPNTRLAQTGSRPATIIRNVIFDGELMTINADISGLVMASAESVLFENITIQGEPGHLITGDSAGAVVGYAYSSTFRDISVRDINIKAKIAGGLAATIDNTFVRRTSIEGKIEQGGGVVGDCVFNIHGINSGVGGLLGQASNSDIQGVETNVTLSGHSLVGGIAGALISTIVSDTRSAGDILSDPDQTSCRGGIAGVTYESILAQSISQIQIYEGFIVGGLIGNSQSYDHILHSYSTSLVKGEITGGLVGYYTSPPRVNSSYWAYDTSRQDHASSLPLDNSMDGVSELRGALFDELGCPYTHTTYGCVSTADFLMLYANWDYNLLKTAGLEYDTAAWDYSTPTPSLRLNTEARSQVGEFFKY
jgi:hypothetical protein